MLFIFLYINILDEYIRRNKIEQVTPQKMPNPPQKIQFKESKKPFGHIRQTKVLITIFKYLTQRAKK